MGLLFPCGEGDNLQVTRQQENDETRDQTPKTTQGNISLNVVLLLKMRVAIIIAGLFCCLW